MKKMLISLVALTGFVLFSGCGGEKKEEAVAPASATEAVKTAEPAPAATETAPAAAEAVVD